MTAIDRYLIWLYVKVMVVAFVSLAGLYVVIDGFNNLDEFLTQGNHHLGKTVLVLGGYYSPRFLQFFDRTAGPLAMAASAFVLTVISRSNELTALMAAGIGPSRVVRSLLAASTVVALLAVANREVGLPSVRALLARNAQDLRGDARKLTPRYDIRSDILISGQSTVANQKQIVAPLFRLPPELAAWGREISAETATHLAADGNHPAGYLLRKVKQPANLAELRTCGLNENPILFSPADSPWLAADECFVASVVPFEQLSAGNAWLQNLSTTELVCGLQSQTIEAGAHVWLVLHARFIRPLLDLCLVLLGIPLVLGRGTRNIFMAAVIGICLAAALVLVVLGCDTLGKNYLLNSTLAAWLPLLIFGPIAYTSARPLWD